MTNRFLHYFLYLQLWLSAPGFAQQVAAGWVLDNIHGPSQIGIVDSIAVDINHDGFMDVVSASIEDGHLRAYINQGASQDLVNLVFEELYVSKEVPGAFRVSATDLNQDGEVDFLVPSIETHEIIALIADDGGYRKQIIASNILLPTDAQAGDFNNDGLMDVISISFELNAVFFHPQDNTGGFGTAILAESVLRPRKLVVDHFNNETALDFMVASEEDSSIRLYENQGDGVFVEQLITNQMSGTRYLASCDANGDDAMDVVVSATADDAVYLFINSGGGIFSGAVIDQDLPGVNALHCADIDNDQQGELIAVANRVGHIYTQDLSGANKQLIANSRDGYVSVQAATFEFNGGMKILTQAYFENRNLLYTANSLGDEEVVWEDFPEGVSAIAKGDINGDGVADIVATSFRDGVVQWYDGVSFKRHVIAENIGGAADVLVVDVDENGALDVVVAASNAGGFYWFRNSGGAEFETTVIYSGAPFANAVAVADINGDGQLDIIGTSGSDDAVRWFDRMGLTFTVHTINQANDAPNDVVASDFDNDGDIDLMVANFFSGDVSLYVNNTADFTELKLIENMNRPYELALVAGADSAFSDVLGSFARGDLVIKFENMTESMFNPIVLLDDIVNPRNLFAIEGDPVFYVASSVAQTLYSITGYSQVNKTEPVVTNHIGVSSIYIDALSRQVYTGSIISGWLAQLTNDRIFTTGFDPL
ncbi:FG-GAP repeat domain-containing protein [Marinicella litoralis]|uniref:VCBS repeat protein n=1 Tax=Marinicella litoralis TaxID=644220 RepID=A0A4R6XVA9_9GAMM|nr:VCBS repeat-containing protein [Marinicella litoralis]TDR23766.1 VCBS repeat protein [Marinicella litoralis]